MKTINKILGYSIILIFSMGLIACSGEDGTDGIDGAIGPQGTAGQDGNANVIASGWIDADWNLTNNPNQKDMRIPITELSKTDLRDNTLVMVYLKQFGTSSIYTMPSAGRWSNTWYSFTFGDNLLGYDGILITLKSTDGVALTELQYAASRGNFFRYVLIPSNTIMGSSTIDYSNYEEIKTFYHLSN